MKKTYTFYSDPGHGWLKVPMDDLRELGLIDQISSHSYCSPKLTDAYLEEDDDATLFLQEYEKQTGTKPTIKAAKQTNNRSRIRSYDAFRSPVYVNRKRKIELLQAYNAHIVREKVDLLHASLSFVDAYRQLRGMLNHTNISPELKRGLALEVFKRHKHNQAVYNYMQTGHRL